MKAEPFDEQELQLFADVNSCQRPSSSANGCQGMSSSANGSQGTPSSVKTTDSILAVKAEVNEVNLGQRSRLV